MAEQMVQDWLEVSQNGEQSLLQEEKVLSALAGCKDKQGAVKTES
jgi:hypothetical protein